MEENLKKAKEGNGDPFMEQLKKQKEELEEIREKKKLNFHQKK
jgi:hypothetical protein